MNQIFQEICGFARLYAQEFVLPRRCPPDLIADLLRMNDAADTLKAWRKAQLECSLALYKIQKREENKTC